ncbi:MAG: NUDIX domain-containing protein [Propionibacteriales bacterium]|nr:NUDIX domain-containing protein [Propionibacteriales bacterium]
MSRVDYYDDPAAPSPNSIVPSVCALVVERDRLLLIHKVDNNRWALPGGGVDVGEAAEAAAVRETLEETGLDIEVVGLVGIYTHPRHVMRYADGEVRQQFSLCFRANAVGGSPRIQPAETKEVRWVSFDQLPSLDIHSSMRLRIEHGLAWGPGDPAHVG